MKHARRWIAAVPLVVLAVALAGCGQGATARPATYPPVIHTNSSSLPGAPDCKQVGVRTAAMWIAREFQTNPAQAMADLKKASPSVQKCITTPTGESTQSSVQRVGP